MTTFFSPSWLYSRFKSRLEFHRTALLCVSLLFLSALSAQAAPQRIVSTSPSITEALFALGLGPHVVGVSNYCEYPSEVAHLPRVGTYLRPDPELIAQLNPDLVVVHKLPNELTNRLSALHIPFAEVDRGTLQDTYTEIRQIGKAAGVDARAESLIDSMQARLKQLRHEAESQKSPTVIFVIGRTPGTLSNLVVVGHDSFIDELIEDAGGKNAMTSDSLAPYPRISLETILRLNPDVIIDLGDMGDSPEKRDKKAAASLALWRTIPDLNAVHSGRIYCLTSTAFIVPGPRAPEAAEALFSILHGRKPQ